MQRRSFYAPCISVIFCLLAGNALAAPPTSSPTLRGSYFVAGSRSCVYASNYLDFGANFQLGASGGTFRTGHYEGILQLNGDGTGSFDFKFIQYYSSHPYVTPDPYLGPGGYPIGSFPGSCNVAYEQNTDGFLNVTLSGCVSTGDAGSGIGTTWISSDESIAMAASGNGDMLILSKTDPIVETTYNELSPGLIIKRICSRTWTGIRLSIR